MNKIILMLTISSGLAIGWKYGSWGGLMGSYMAAVAGASLGLYLGQRFIRNRLDDD